MIQPFNRCSPRADTPMRTLLTIFFAASLCAPRAFTQDAAPADRNAINTRARPGGMMADSPVTFPKQGALPAQYGEALKSLAAEQHCAYLDMTGPWAEYIRSSKRHPHVFYRDVVHANEYGEQILAKIMMAFWTAPGARQAASPQAPWPQRSLESRPIATCAVSSAATWSDARRHRGLARRCNCSAPRKNLSWQTDAAGRTVVIIPASLAKSPPCRHAFALKFSPVIRQ
jgi:hypothetical protein